MQIAMDGPVATGKGTVAKLVAERLGWLNVDTGAMYRVIALLGLRMGANLSDEEAMLKIARSAEIEMYPQKHGKEVSTSGVRVIVNGEDVSEEIRSPEVGKQVHLVAALRAVREILVEKQQEMAKKQNVVMEGRDITYRVLPKADLKIYLNADEKERIRRRFKQYEMKGQNVTWEQAESEVKNRDQLDMNRKTDPLMIVPDAWVLDTTNLTIDEVVETILKRWMEVKQEKNIAKTK